MGKEVGYKNRDRFIQLGIAISTLRRIRGLSQEKLAEKANISRSLLSNIEAPNMAYSFSLEVLYNIADALDITPEQLIKASVFSDEIIAVNKDCDYTKNGYFKLSYKYIPLNYNLLWTIQTSSFSFFLLLFQ